MPPLAISAYDLECRQALGGLDRQDGAGGGRLAVIDVTDRADVDVRLCPFEIFLSHCYFLTDNNKESKKG